MERIDWLVSEMNVLGGAEMFVCLAAPRLRAIGWDLRLITLSKGGELLDQLRSQSVPVIELEIDRLNIRDGVRLMQILHQDKPRLLHTHLYHAGIAGRLLGSLAGIRTIVVHQQGPEQRRSNGRTWLDRHTSGLVDRYLVTCESVKMILHQREHIPIEKIAIIPNGIDIGAFQQTYKRPAAWPVTPQVPIIGAVGRLSPEKGHHLFIDALSILRQQGCPFHAIVIGEGDSRDELTQKTKHLQLDEHISWVGKQTNVQEWLPFMDVFVLPSHWEGISLALLEAMAAGLPVVATHVGGNPDVVVNGSTGFLTQPSDPVQLAEAIRKLIESPILRQAMGQMGKSRCQEHFHIDVIVNRLNSFYQQILSDNSHAR
jgi:glycosyltransferase involved in cell wall biosynthesis